MAPKRPKTGFAVRPASKADVGAMAPAPRKARPDRTATVDATFKDALNAPAQVTPGGRSRMIAVPSYILGQLLAELVPEQAAQHAYQRQFGSRAAEAALRDLQKFREALDDDDPEGSRDPYASIRPAPKKDKEA